MIERASTPLILCASVIVASAGCVARAGDPKPTIEFTTVPPAAEGGPDRLVQWVQPDEVAVNQLHGFAGGQSQDKVRVGPQFSRHYPGDQARGGFLVGLNDDFDAADSSRFAQRRQEKGQ